MKVIFIKDVANVAKANEVKEVSDGFARHKLIPEGLAVNATKAAIEKLRQEQEKENRERAEKKAIAERQLALIDEKTVTVKVSVGKNDRMFGSVTSADVAKHILDQYGVEVDKKKIDMPDGINKVTSIGIKVKLFDGVVAPMMLNVVSE